MSAIQGDTSCPAQSFGSFCEGPSAAVVSDAAVFPRHSADVVLHATVVPDVAVVSSRRARCLHSY